MTPNTAADAALSAAEFAVLMAGIGGFEPAPRLAVAVSGGADSMALALRAHGWAAERGGTVLALTVDHGLRPESAGEAADTQKQLVALGIAHEILPWRGEKPSSGIEAAARAARYDLLTGRAVQAGMLHLLTAHHADDQAETILLRLSRGSGPDGLAGMPAVTYLAPLRLVRPLLTVPRVRLRATCQGEGLTWAEDPTNASPTLARGRLRQIAPLLAREGMTAQSLTMVGARAAAQRRHLEQETAAVLAAGVTLSPFGFAWIDAESLRRAGELLGVRALARVLVTVGGLDYPPAGDALSAAWARLHDAGIREYNIAGCRVVRHGEGDGGRWLVCRDGGLVTDAAPLAAGRSQRWDRRYQVVLSADAGDGYRVAALGPSGWKALCRSDAWLARQNIPGPVRAALPALWRDSQLIELADFGLRGSGQAVPHLLGARFNPQQPMAGHAFTVVSPPSHIIYCS